MKLATHNRTIKMRFIDVNWSTNIDLKVDDSVEMWKYKNMFWKGSTPNWSEVKNTVPWTNVIQDLNGVEIG